MSGAGHTKKRFFRWNRKGQPRPTREAQQVCPRYEWEVYVYYLIAIHRPPGGAVGLYPACGQRKYASLVSGEMDAKKVFLATHPSLRAAGGRGLDGRYRPGVFVSVCLFLIPTGSSIDRAQSAADQSNYVVSFSTRTEDHACGCARVRGQS